MAKLTDNKSGTIAKAEPPEKGARFIFDDHRDAPRGFALRITAAGGKAFVLRYTSPTSHRQRLFTIGDWPTWSLEAARDEACARRRQIDIGIDPLEEERKNRDAPTVKAAVEEFIKARVKGLASERAVIGYFTRDILPSLEAERVKDVRRRQIIAIVEQKARETPTAARHVLAYLKAFFDWCVDQEYIEASPATVRPGSIAPGGKKAALKPKARGRVLSDDELRTFWHSVEACGMNRLTALALKLVLVTGQRPGEVAGMHASEIDGNTWVIPAARRGKTETENRVPLTPLAMEIIGQAREEVARLQPRRLKSKGKQSSGFIFEIQHGRPAAVGSLSKAVARFADELENREHATWGPWRPHDLRRTCRTGLSACGVPPEIAERVIGHGPTGILAVYDRHAFDAEKLAALLAWERRLRAILDGKDPDTSNVVPFRRRAAG